MQTELTRERLRHLMQELARGAPRDGGPFAIYLVGGGSAVYAGWRESSIDADLHTDDERLFRNIQEIKERLQLNVELVRPEHFVPALEGAKARHVLLDQFGQVQFYHYDPYSQLFSKIVRGFDRDLTDARGFIASGLADIVKFRALVDGIPDAAFARYPSLSPRSVRAAVQDFLAHGL